MSPDKDSCVDDLTTSPGSVTHEYFVDESGDLTLFDATGRIIVGREGVSHTFMVGAAFSEQWAPLCRDLEALRSTLLADKYFRHVPSMQMSAGKTALAFHAKDDVQEVRREVFALLRESDVKLFAAFRRKLIIARHRKAFWRRTGVKRDDEEIYEKLVENVFANRLHLATENRITFSRRGTSERAEALSRSIGNAKAKFDRKWKKGIDRPTTIVSAQPHEHGGLQVVDYLLWALQRFVEKGESRFFEYLADRYSLIVDEDDVRRRNWGEYYSSKNPLTPEKMLPVTEARLKE